MKLEKQSETSLSQDLGSFEQVVPSTWNAILLQNAKPPSENLIDNLTSQVKLSCSMFSKYFSKNRNLKKSKKAVIVLDSKRIISDVIFFLFYILSKNPFLSESMLEKLWRTGGILIPL